MGWKIRGASSTTAEKPKKRTQSCLEKLPSIGQSSITPLRPISPRGIVNRMTTATR